MLHGAVPIERLRIRTEQAAETGPAQVVNPFANQHFSYVQRLFDFPDGDGVLHEEVDQPLEIESLFAHVSAH